MNNGLISRINHDDLCWTEKQLPQKERTKHVHGLHPYMGKFVPQLISYFLERDLKKCRYILDPFVGSGTTLIESNLHQKNGLGLDISLFNTILCNVKSNDYDLKLLENEIKDIYNKMSVSKKIMFTDSKYINTWYHKEAVSPLLTFASLIKNYHYKNVLKVILSRAARSSRMVPHFEVDFPQQPQTTSYYCHKHFRTCHPTKNGIGFLKRYCNDTFLRLSNFSKIRKNTFVNTIHTDARTFHYEENEIDGVITSPPYIGLIDYHDQHRYAYEFLQLKDKSSFEIGRKINGLSKKAIKQYSNDMTSVFNNMANNCQKLEKIIIIVNDKFNIYENILSNANISIKKRLSRSVERRSGRRGKSYSEDVLICRIDKS